MPASASYRPQLLIGKTSYHSDRIQLPDENINYNMASKTSTYQQTTTTMQPTPTPPLPAPQAKPSTTTPPTPSSSTAGFFQTPPLVLNQLADDIALQRSLQLFLPPSVQQQVTPELQVFGDRVLSKPVLALMADAEHNPPYLKPFSTWGKRQDELITSEGWRKLSAIGIEEGMVAIGYENAFGQYSRAWQFIKYLVWTGSSCWVTCPSLMTDGVATLMLRHLTAAAEGEEEGGEMELRNAAMQSAYDRLTSRDPEFAWTTGQWMTERQGGSDVSQTETLAHHSSSISTSTSTGTDGVPLGPWRCNGFKWFSSATDSQLTVFLARTPRGISTFMAPMRRTLSADPSITELNGIQIQRLKNKLGTRALPTAELVLQDVHAHLIGTEGQGVKEIATVLNVARVHNGVTAVGFWGRGLSVVRAFARVRKVGLKPLCSKPAFVRCLARMHVEYKAHVLLCGFVSSLLGVVEQPMMAAYRRSAAGVVEATRTLPKPEDAELLFRLLTPVLKGLGSKVSIAGLAECMECMGGVGYLENDDPLYNIARLFRDVNVCSIWEGTTDMMSADVLRVLHGKTAPQTLRALETWLTTLLSTSHPSLSAATTALTSLFHAFKHDITTLERGELDLHSRSYMEQLGDLVMGTLVVVDAGDGDEVATAAVGGWMEERGLDGGEREGGWRGVVGRDLLVVFGGEVVEGVERPRL